MSDRTLLLKRTAVGLLGLALAGGFLRAASDKKFDEQRAELCEKAKASQKELGYSQDAEGRKKVFNEHPSPQVKLCKVVQVGPGGSATIEITGTFEPGTTFLVDNDAVTLASPVTGSTSFKAAVNIDSSLGPGFVRIHAFSPVSCGSAACDVVFVDKAQEYSLTASNGWTVLFTPQAKAFQMSGGPAKLEYLVEFFKPGERKAFATRRGVREISSGTGPGADFYMSLQEQASGAMAEMEALQKKMTDPQAFMKMSPKEQEELMEKFTKLSERAMKEMAGTADLAAIQRKQDEFGCGSVSFRFGEPGQMSGTISCGKNVGDLTFTGTAK